MSNVDRRYFESLMAQRKLSLKSLATRMGMQHSQLSLTFSGQRRMQLDEAGKLADIFGVTLQKVAQAAGVVEGRASGKRVPVIGAMTGSGVVELYRDDVIERTALPEGLPEETIAVQAHTADSPAFWLDGWIFFCVRSRIIEPEAIGRFCLAKIKDGNHVIATVRRGYRDGSFNLSGPYTKESERLEWATPILLTRT